MEDLQQRAARGVALATLAVACVLVGPAPRLMDALERTYAVAVVEEQRHRRRRRHLVPALGLRRSDTPRPSRPGPARP